MSDFDRLVADLLADEFAAMPTRASYLGVPGYDDRLPDLSAAALRSRERRDDEWAGRFRALDDAALTTEECIDRDLVLMSLRRRAIVRDWPEWRRDAESYLQPALLGIFALVLRRLRPEPELVSSAVARLRGVPDLIAAAHENLDPELAAPLLVRRAVEHARGAERYLRDWLPGEAAQGAERDRLAAAAHDAAEAVAGHTEWLERFAELAHGDWAIGEARYSALLREAEGLPYGAAELRERGRAAYDELAAELADRASELDGSTDWRELLNRLNDDHPSTLEAMRSEYADATMRARTFCVEHDLVTMPEGEVCEVVPSPPHERAVTAVAFYFEPPPFSDRRTGHFFVPFTPEGAPAEQVRQRLASNSRMSIPTTAVHEAYPGHHWHLAWLAAVCDRPARKVFESAYFVEGWALYAEQMLREQGFFTDPRHVIGQIEARLFRAARIVVDTSLHLGEMTVEEASAFMTEKVGLSRETARAEVVRYCAWPTQASAYLTGAIEIQRMRDEWVGGGGSLRDFHDRLAGSGTLPLALAERALLAR